MAPILCSKVFLRRGGNRGMLKDVEEDIGSDEGRNVVKHVSFGRFLWSFDSFCFGLSLSKGWIHKRTLFYDTYFQQNPPKENPIPPK